MRLDKKLLRETISREIYRQVSPGAKRQIIVGGLPVEVEIADTPEKRDLGLMFRRSLMEDQGMLFDFHDEDHRGFWMKNTPLPLSIAFISGDGKIVSIKDMVPNSLETVRSDFPCRYALEMNSGWFKRNGLSAGSQCLL